MIFCIVLLIMSIIELAVMAWYEQKERTKPYLVWLTIISSCSLIISLFALVNYNNPTALDVYQGKTTLEITYRDSVVIDSTVVYKVK